jgi:hypothetical protein
MENVGETSVNFTVELTVKVQTEVQVQLYAFSKLCATMRWAANDTFLPLYYRE